MPGLAAMHLPVGTPGMQARRPELAVRGRSTMGVSPELRHEDVSMPEFTYTDLLPTGPDDTQYRLLTEDGISRRVSLGKEFLEVEPEVLTLLAGEAMRDIAHLLRPAHLRQLRAILDDPEASGNDRFVAGDLLKNACIPAGGVLPMCQDTGTAIVMGKRGGEGVARRPEGG